MDDEVWTLVASDQEDDATRLARFLAVSGHDVRICADPALVQEYLQSARAPVHHVVIDFGSDHAAAQRILSIAERIEPAPHVIMTPTAVDGDRVAALYGRCVVLPKPVAPHSVLAVMDAQRGDALSHFCAAYSLSPREIAVVRHAMQGLTMKAVADGLSCSVHTVHTHWKRISKKSGLSGRAFIAAAAQSVRRGSAGLGDSATRQA